MQLKRRGKVWYIVDIINGVEFRKSTKLRDRQAAEAVFAEYQREKADPRLAAAKRAVVADGIQLTYDYHDAQQNSAGTKRKCRQKLGHYARLWGLEMPLSEITASLVDDYIYIRCEAPGPMGDMVERITVREELAALRTLLECSRRAGICATLPVDVLPVRFTTDHQPGGETHTVAEAWKLIRSLPRHRGAHVAFIFATGARWGESLRAKRSDVFGDRVRLEVTKTRRRTGVAERYVPVTSFTRGFLDYAMAYADGADRLFRPWGKYHRDVNIAAEAAELVGTTSPNDWRRSFITWHREAGVPDEIAAGMLGHTDPKLVRTTYGALKGGTLNRALANAVPELCDENSETVRLVSGSIENQPDEGDLREASEVANLTESLVSGGAADGIRTRDLRFTKAMSAQEMQRQFALLHKMQAETVRKLSEVTAALTVALSRRGDELP